MINKRIPVLGIARRYHSGLGYRWSVLPNKSQSATRDDILRLAETILQLSEKLNAKGSFFIVPLSMARKKWLFLARVESDPQSHGHRALRAVLTTSRTFRLTTPYAMWGLSSLWETLNELLVQPVEQIVSEWQAYDLVLHEQCPPQWQEQMQQTVAFQGLPPGEAALDMSQNLSRDTRSTFTSTTGTIRLSRCPQSQALWLEMV